MSTAHFCAERVCFVHRCKISNRGGVLKFNWQRFLLALISLRLLCLHTRTLLPFPSLLLQSIFVPWISLLCPVQCRTYTRFFTRNRLHYLVLSKSTNWVQTVLFFAGYLFCCCCEGGFANNHNKTHLKKIVFNGPSKCFIFIGRWGECAGNANVFGIADFCLVRYDFLFLPCWLKKQELYSTVLLRQQSKQAAPYNASCQGHVQQHNKRICTQKRRC